MREWMEPNVADHREEASLEHRPPPSPPHWSRTDSALQNHSAAWVKSIVARSSRGGGGGRLGRFLKCAGCCRLGGGVSPLPSRFP